MKLIKSKFEIIEQQAGLEGIYKAIEQAGRTCYKSENLITEDSAKGFVDRMINNKHYAMLEHGTVYLSMFVDYRIQEEDNDWYKYSLNKYSKLGHIYKVGSDSFMAITTNLRVLVENGWMDDLKYLCEPTEYHEKRVCIRFTCDVGISREFNRHRVNSMAEQSTRYCNYSNDKFSNELAIIRPTEISEGECKEAINKWTFVNNYDNDEDTAFRYMCDRISYTDDDAMFGAVDTWLFSNLACQWSYMRLLKLGWKPQQARRVLPLDLQTELVHTVFVSDWEHFFLLRDDTHAHPQAIELAHPLKEEFIKREYIK